MSGALQLPLEQLPFEAVLFDMDGTLVDTEPLWQAAEVELMGSFGLDWSDQDMAHSLGGSTMRVAHYMADLIGASGQERPDPDVLAEQFLETMLGNLREDPPPAQPGAEALLREVKNSGIPAALVSSSSRDLMTAVLDALGDEWFSVTISADDVARHKPDPLPYTKACGALNVDPRHTLAIEDSPTGAAAATAAGAFVVAVEHLAPIPAAARRVVITSLEGVTIETLAGWYR